MLTSRYLALTSSNDTVEVGLSGKASFGEEAPRACKWNAWCTVRGLDMCRISLRDVTYPLPPRAPPMIC